MQVMKTFWIEGKPTVDDIQQAYDIVKNEGVVVEFKWFVPYNGMHDRKIRAATIEKYLDPKVYFDECIPHTYGV